MATEYASLAQDNPGASLTVLYTATGQVVATLRVANRSSVTRTFRVALSRAGASIVDDHYLAYDTPLDANDSVPILIYMSNTDVLRVYGSTADVSFNLGGALIT